MYFMGETRLPEGVLPPPDTRSWQQRGADFRGQFVELMAADHERQRLALNPTSDDASMTEAYDKRIADVAALTGVALKNPYRQPGFYKPDVRLKLMGLDSGDIAYNQELERNFAAQLKTLAEQRPELAPLLRADEPVANDALALVGKAGQRLQAAEGKAKDLSSGNSLFAQLLGSGSAMLRDPLGAASMLFGGGTPAVAKTVGAKIAARVLTEGAINGGVEGVMQVASADWQRKAGVENPGFWKQVGLAAAFGGGLGGLFQGGAEVFARTGRGTADTTAAMERMVKGEFAEADVRTLADAMGVKVSDGDMASLSRALEADADTAAVLTPDVEPRLLADTVKAIEDGSPLPRMVDEVDTAHVPPGLRKKAVEGNQSDIVAKQGVGAEVPPIDAIREISDPNFTAFVDSENAARLSKLEDFVAMNEADIAHLRDDGALDAMPSERDFSAVRGASDEHRASIVLAELEAKVARTKAEIAGGPRHNVNDPATQIAYARQNPQPLVQPELKTGKRATPASPEAVEAAAQKLATAGGVKPTAMAKPDEFVKRETLDIMDALPGGTDAGGNPVSTTHAELTDAATRMADLADLIASCKS